MQYLISSQLLLSNVPQELKTITDYIINNDKLIINLEQVNNIDSSGIALLIEVKILAKKYNKIVYFANPTESITKLSELYQVSI